jgi:GNAT superfamily N-acetyltransferase
VVGGRVFVGSASHWLGKKPLMNTSDNLLFRRGTVEDAQAIADAFRAIYGNSSHPFQCADDVASFLKDDRNHQLICEADDCIVGGAAMIYGAWNDSYELGRAFTTPAFRGNGLAGRLMAAAVREICDRRLGQVFFGFPRTRRIAELGAALEPRFTTVGHDGGRHIAQGSVEIHLTIQAVPSYGGFLHVAPPIASLLESCMVQWASRCRRARIRSIASCLHRGAIHAARAPSATISSSVIPTIPMHRSK